MQQCLPQNAPSGDVVPITPADTPQKLPIYSSIVSLGSLRLQYGYLIDETSLAVCQYAHRNRRQAVYLVLGGICAHRYVAGTAEHNGSWREMVGPGKALDTRDAHIISVDFLGSRQSTAPEQLDEFIISPRDQATVLVRLLDKLQIERLDGVIGSSYGGNVALSLAEHYPDRVKQALIVCAAHKACVQTSGYRSVQRAVVRHCTEQGQAQQGLALARQLAMLGFRSADEFNQRFAEQARQHEQQIQLAIEPYLKARGESWSQTTTPAAFICLSQSCDLTDVKPEQVQIPVWLAAAENDAIVPFHDVESLAKQLPALHSLTRLESLTGHDAFLTETQQLETLLYAFVTQSNRIAGVAS